MDCLCERKYMPPTISLKSPSFCSRSQAENPHNCCVLPLSDEFRERIAFCGSHEKFGKCLAQRVCNDKLRWRDAENSPLLRKIYINVICLDRTINSDRLAIKCY